MDYKSVTETIRNSMAMTFGSFLIHRSRPVLPNMSLFGRIEKHVPALLNIVQKITSERMNKRENHKYLLRLGVAILFDKAYGVNESPASDKLCILYDGNQVMTDETLTIKY